LRDSAGLAPASLPDRDRPDHRPYPPSVRRSARIVVASVVLSGLAGGCAQTDYDASELRAGLSAAGLTRDQATCIVRAMQREFGIERLGARDEPGADERAGFAQIYDRCTGVALPR